VLDDVLGLLDSDRTAHAKLGASFAADASAATVDALRLGTE
jgi:hypothetical protein